MLSRTAVRSLSHARLSVVHARFIQASAAAVKRSQAPELPAASSSHSPLSVQAKPRSEDAKVPNEKVQQPQKAASQAPASSETWLTGLIRRNAIARRVFLALMSGMGYNSPKQAAARRAFFMYEYLCATRAAEEKQFWLNGEYQFNSHLKYDVHGFSWHRLRVVENLSAVLIANLDPHPTLVHADLSRLDCALPPTFQSWFTVTNLHIWLLTVRLRALPKPHGEYYIQALLDHFFYDVEDRIRSVLQPSVQLTTRVPPPVSSSTLSPPPNPAHFKFAPFYDPPKRDGLPKGNAPERLVTRQMKIMKEQWAGLGLSMDVALVRGDAEMAGTVWRNLLGGRGARGIIYPDSSDAQSAPSSPSAEAAAAAKPFFRRSVNLVGGEIDSVRKLDKAGLEAEEKRDDGSGVHDFAPSEADKYVMYPEVMAEVVEYVRRELVRLQDVPDSMVLGTVEDAERAWERMRFKRIRRDDVRLNL